MCADNGIVEENVSQSGQDVTAIVAANMASRKSSVCLMAGYTGAQVIPVDIGIACETIPSGKKLMIWMEFYIKDKPWYKKFSERTCYDR